MHILVAPDKFKGSLSAAEVSRCLAAGVRAAGLRATELPLADGGDGSVDAALAAGFGSRPITVAGATGLPTRGRIALRGDTALIEVAGTCGLATLPCRRLAPLDSSSLGFGQALRQALRHRPRRIVLALGGSAGIDGGMGLLTALGVRWYDRAGHPLRPCGRTLGDIARAEVGGAVELGGVELLAACDVTNPLTGPNGAAAVYGPQKGATATEIGRLDAGLRNMVEALAAASSPGPVRSAAVAPGAGSAGGIGFAAALLGAELISGADFFLDLLGFDRRLPDSDLVITGEGSLDGQSAHGKLPTVIARRARPIPVVAVAGRSTLARTAWDAAGFAAVHTLAEHTTADTAADPDLTATLLTDIGRRIAHALTEPLPAARDRPSGPETRRMSDSRAVDRERPTRHSGDHEVRPADL
ncbi:MULTISPECIES: glycerate kinase [unclassified Nocardia]|uniref:glycerate kinase n=1 Tax=unclassified Nocardia TaxID=2637762 RepID=UPI0024A88D1A|nr:MULTISPECIES: glycerate kinase [unclassified Nocardia]